MVYSWYLLERSSRKIFIVRVQTTPLRNDVCVLLYIVNFYYNIQIFYISLIDYLIILFILEYLYCYTLIIIQIYDRLCICLVACFPGYTLSLILYTLRTFIRIVLYITVVLHFYV